MRMFLSRSLVCPKINDVGRKTENKRGGSGGKIVDVFFPASVGRLYTSNEKLGSCETMNE